uniref:Ig-like domain-containing protein n=1 Tax=Parascaris equorum TaxID=6256 RepID=A0A914S1E9_PAREQ
MMVFVLFIAAPLRVQIDPPKNLQVPRGGRAQWYCHIVGHSLRTKIIVWLLVLIISGHLYMGAQSVFAFGSILASVVPFLRVISRLYVEKRANTPIVSPPSQSVDVGVPARFECSVPGNDDAELHWRREDGSSLGYGVTDEHGVLTFTNASVSNDQVAISS